MTESLDDAIERYRYNMAMVHLVGLGCLEVVDAPPDDYTCRMCRCCGYLSYGVQRRRLNTAYADPESNWLESCRECWEGAVEYYSDLWSQYWSDVM